MKRFLSVLRDITFVIFVIIICGMIFLMSSGKHFSIAGYQVLRVLTSSMEPAIAENTCIIIKKVSVENLQVGDIITFTSDDPQIQGYYNTHRIHEIVEDNGETLYVTKGDAISTIDAYPVHQDQVAGVFVKELPGGRLIGKCFVALSDNKIYFLVIILPLMMCLMSYFWQIMGIFKKYDDEDNARDEEEDEDEEDEEFEKYLEHDVKEFMEAAHLEHEEKMESEKQDGKDALEDEKREVEDESDAEQDSEIESLDAQNHDAQDGEVVEGDDMKDENPDIEVEPEGEKADVDAEMEALKLEAEVEQPDQRADMESNNQNEQDDDEDEGSKVENPKADVNKEEFYVEDLDKDDDYDLNNLEDDEDYKYTSEDFQEDDYKYSDEELGR